MSHNIPFSSINMLSVQGFSVLRCLFTLPEPMTYLYANIQKHKGILTGRVSPLWWWCT